MGLPNELCQNDLKNSMPLEGRNELSNRMDSGKFSILTNMSMNDPLDCFKEGLN